nr:PAS domain S-box protein [Lysinibacillus timonensis]
MVQGQSMENDFSTFSNMMLNVFNSIQDSFFVMEVHENSINYVLANKAGMKAIKVNENIFGKTFYDVLPKESAEFLHKQHLKVAKTNKVVKFEDQTEINGEIFISETILTPINNYDELYIVAIVRDITDRMSKLQELQRAKRLLQHNELRLNSLFENNEDAVFMLDKDGYVLEANEANKSIFGYTPLELMGTNLFQIISKQQMNDVKEWLNRTIMGETVNYETVIYHKNGTEIYAQIKQIPIIEEGIVTGIFGIAKDITEQKKAINKLNRVNEQLESFVNHSNDSISIINLNYEIEFINEAFTKVFGFTKKDIIHQPNGTIPDWLKNEAQEQYKQVLQGKKMQNVHVQRQTKTGQILDLSVTLSPLYDEFGEVIGISSIARNITEQKKKEKEMKKIKKQHDLIWNYSTDAIFMLGHNGKILHANPTFSEMFQLRPDELLNMPLTNIYLDNQVPQLDELLGRIRKQEHLQFETKRKRKDGSIVDIIATYRPINDEMYLAIVIYKDITKEKQVVTKLKKSEEKFRRVIEYSPEPLVIHNGKIITYVNQAAINLLKAQKASQVIGKPLLQFVHHSYKQPVSERAKSTKLLGEKATNQEEIFIDINGEKIYAESTTASISENGEHLIVVMFRDVTQKKRADQALRQSEERFRIIAENSKSIIKILNLNGNISFVSPSIEDVLGYSIREEIGKSLYQNIYPDDLTLAKATLKKVIDEKEAIEIEIRHLHKDGYAVWLNSHFTPIISPEQELERIMIFSDDITDVKNREKKLKKLAYYDHLTGLPNRRLFNEQLNQAIITSEKTRKLTALLVIDCDKFKSINDTYGHDIGDEVIKEFARRIKSSLRKQDTVSRVGGDEFTVVLPEVNNKEAVQQISKRLLHTVQNPMYFKEHEIQVTASIGISFYPVDTTSVEELFKLADNNLYKSKELGRNMFTF